MAGISGRIMRVIRSCGRSGQAMRSLGAVLLGLMVAIGAGTVAAGSATTESPGPAVAAESEADLREIRLVDAAVAALAGNPRLRAARARLASAASRLQEAQGGLLSQWHVEAGATRTQLPEGSEAPTTPPTPHYQLPDDVFVDSQTASVTWSRSLWASPQARAAVEGASAELAGSHGEFQSVLSQVVQQTAEAYLDLLQAQVGVGVAESRLAWLTEQLRIVENRRAQEAATEVDVLEARSAWRQAEADVDHARRGVSLAAKQLSLWMGEPLSSEIKAIDPLAAEDPVIMQALAEVGPLLTGEQGDLHVDIDSALALAMERRAEVQAAQRGVRAARAGLEATEAAGKARVSLMGSYRWPEVEAGFQLDRWGRVGATLEGSRRQFDGVDISPERDHQEWTVGVQVGWTLSDAGVQREQASQAQAGIRAAEAQWAELRAGLEMELQAAVHGLHRAVDTEEIAGLRLQEAEDALARVERLVAAGAAPEADALGARVRAEAARVEWLTARWQRAAVELAVALAIGWIPTAPEEGEPVLR